MTTLRRAWSNLGSLAMSLGRFARKLGRLADGAAWFFVFASLVPVLWVVGVKLGDPGGTATIFRTDIGPEVFEASGMVYEGWLGLVAAVGQIAVVLTAAVLSVRSGLKRRIIGHGILVAWAAFWTANAFEVAESGWAPSVAQAGFVSLLCACTCFRAARECLPRPGGGTKGNTPVDAAKDGGKGNVVEMEPGVTADMETDLALEDPAAPTGPKGTLKERLGSIPFRQGVCAVGAGGRCAASAVQSVAARTASGARSLAATVRHRRAASRPTG